MNALTLHAIVALVLLMMLEALSSPAAAHESRPVYIEVNEVATEQYVLQWKIPPSLSLFNIPSVTLPDACETQGPLAEFSGPDGLVRRSNYHCAKGLAGKAIAINYPSPNPSVSSLVRYNTVRGERHMAVVSPQETYWIVPQAETRTGVARQYLLLGIEHIWTGVDHLLFLVCLLWIAGTWRRILITITGFTLAHSATLVLSAVDVVRLPIPPVEAAIALSIVFVATEIVKGRRQSLTWRYPIAVSSSFGLLHGFGFAAALARIGLPQTELVTGLLFFNAGVEFGQVLFAAGVVGLMQFVQWLTVWWSAETSLSALPRMMVGYTVGPMAVFWLIERSIAF